MEQLIIVTHPEPLSLEARRIAHEAVPEGGVGVGYYFDGKMIARSVVTSEAVGAIRTILSTPVSVALAATEDDSGNIEARLCLVLPIEETGVQEEDDAAEPWKSSIPELPDGIESDGSFEREEDGDEHPQLALFPLGNIVRHARSRNHLDDVAADAREMLENVLGGAADDAVQRAIDELLSSI